MLRHNGENTLLFKICDLIKRDSPDQCDHEITHLCCDICRKDICSKCGFEQRHDGFPRTTCNKCFNIMLISNFTCCASC